ncbi:hypothetical protein TRICI_001954 [Trichomonascus ciferrii]|uniref:Uncharacterized protein n=1 Tax=Trichomonascus ciferrii TaxID=44093 RepID=A0A642V774_9ASCO|nr:hypothetical protein TRICI_001954 [Trichomonascus ciferrii]
MDSKLSVIPMGQATTDDDSRPKGNTRGFEQQRLDQPCLLQGPGWPPANLTHNWFSGGTPPDPLGSLRSRLWLALCSFYSLKPRRATGVQGAGPLQT